MKLETCYDETAEYVYILTAANKIQ